MSDASMSWDEIVEVGKNNGFLAKQFFVVQSMPANGLAPVLAVLDEHAKFQVHLEDIGVMWAAGPFSNDDGDAWDGEGFFVYRAESKEEATRYAEQDPMHSSGARTFRIRKWLLAEGRFDVRINYATGEAEIL